MNDVQVKTLLERSREKKPEPAAAIDFADRARITARWFDRAQGEAHTFTGSIRVLSVGDLLEATAVFHRVVGNVPYETIPTEVRNRLWPQAKLIVMFRDQPGGKELVDACDTDRFLLSALMQEVERLEAECFHNVLAASEGVEGEPRVVVATGRAIAASTSSAPPR